MDYTDDDCMNEFTPGQTDRLKQQIATFRSFPDSGTKWKILFRIHLIEQYGFPSWLTRVYGSWRFL